MPHISANTTSSTLIYLLVSGFAFHPQTGINMLSWAGNGGKTSRGHGAAVAGENTDNTEEGNMHCFSSSLSIFFSI